MRDIYEPTKTRNEIYSDLYCESDLNEPSPRPTRAQAMAAVAQFFAATVTQYVLDQKGDEFATEAICEAMHYTKERYGQDIELDAIIIALTEEDTP